MNADTASWHAGVLGAFEVFSIWPLLLGKQHTIVFLSFDNASKADYPRRGINWSCIGEDRKESNSDNLE